MKRNSEMKRHSLVWLFVCLFAVGYFGGVPIACGQQKVVDLSVNWIFPPTHRHTALINDWAKDLEKRTNGRVKATIFPNNQLVAADKCYDGIVRGIADVGMSLCAYTRGKFPLTEVIDLPMGASSGLKGTRIMNAFYKTFKPKEFNEAKILLLHGHGPGLLHTSRNPVATLEDIKGLKIRCHGMSAKLVEKLGGAPVGMPIGDTYDALSRGIAEGVMCPYEALEGFRLGEVVKYTTESYPVGYHATMFIAMNLKKWNSLPPDIQKIMDDLSEEYIDKFGQRWDDIDTSAKDFILKRGNKIVPLAAGEGERWQKAVKPLADEYLEMTKSRGLKGQEALDFFMTELKKS